MIQILLRILLNSFFLVFNLKNVILFLKNSWEMFL